MTEYFDLVAQTLAALQVGIVLTVSIVIVVHYSRHRSMAHIAVVSTSYIILTALVAGAIIFKIFLNGPARSISTVAAIVAFMLGNYGLWKVWHSRNDVKESKAFVNFEQRITSNETRLTNLEARLEQLPGTEDSPVHVKVVDHEE